MKGTINRRLFWYDDYTIFKENIEIELWYSEGIGLTKEIYVFPDEEKKIEDTFTEIISIEEFNRLRNKTK